MQLDAIASSVVFKNSDEELSDQSKLIAQPVDTFSTSTIKDHHLHNQTTSIDKSCDSSGERTSKIIDMVLHHQHQTAHSVLRKSSYDDNNNNHPQYTHIQQLIETDNYHSVSSDTAVLRSGLIYMYSPYATNSTHHQNSVANSASASVSTTGPATTIDEVIADTLKDENCTMDNGGKLLENCSEATRTTRTENGDVLTTYEGRSTYSGNGASAGTASGSNGNANGSSADDGTAHYLSLTSPNELQHVKDNIYINNGSHSKTTSNNNNNNNSSNNNNHSTVSSDGESKSPTEMSHEEYDSTIQSFTNLTSANSNNNRENVYDRTTLMATLPNAQIIASINNYDSTLHPTGR